MFLSKHAMVRVNQTQLNEGTKTAREILENRR